MREPKTSMRFGRIIDPLSVHVRRSFRLWPVEAAEPILAISLSIEKQLGLQAAAKAAVPTRQGCDLSVARTGVVDEEWGLWKLPCWKPFRRMKSGNAV